MVPTLSHTCMHVHTHMCTPTGAQCQTLGRKTKGSTPLCAGTPGDLCLRPTSRNTKQGSHSCFPGLCFLICKMGAGIPIPPFSPDLVLPQSSSYLCQATWHVFNSSVVDWLQIPRDLSHPKKSPWAHFLAPPVGLHQ